MIRRVLLLFGVCGVWVGCGGELTDQELYQELPVVSSTSLPLEALPDCGDVVPEEGDQIVRLNGFDGDLIVVIRDGEAICIDELSDWLGDGGEDPEPEPEPDDPNPDPEPDPDPDQEPDPDPEPDPEPEPEPDPEPDPGVNSGKEPDCGHGFGPSFSKDKKNSLPKDHADGPRPIPWLEDTEANDD